MELLSLNSPDDPPSHDRAPTSTPSSSPAAEYAAARPTRLPGCQACGRAAAGYGENVVGCLFERLFPLSARRSSPRAGAPPIARTLPAAIGATQPRPPVPEAAVSRLIGTVAPRLGEQLCCLIDAPDSLGKG
jgi:hypothetical protein